MVLLFRHSGLFNRVYVLKEPSPSVLPGCRLLVPSFSKYGLGSFFGPDALLATERKDKQEPVLHIEQKRLFPRHQ